ncbi:MAG: MoaA/NifB/PqqE/SkfB family radical SAM enzyme [Rhodothermales bacterium]|jgi:MoaA/NifB/PqqE/SkfB family radical SAM enzyme
MHHLDTPEWLRTPQDDPRGYIQPHGLRELWFHTGTNCNLRCPFCLEGSKPGDTRIGFIRYDEYLALAEEALGMGVEKFSFTGGEPFVNPDMVRILDHALDHRPCLVLTNATEPLMNRIGEILHLADKPHVLNLRVSLDYSDPKKHDAGRGKGNFRKALRTLGRLHKQGFNVSIARLRGDKENIKAVDAEYAEHFAEAGLPSDTTIVSFPDFQLPGTIADVPYITETCMTKYLNADQRAAFMCSDSKMVVKKGDHVGVYACTLVDDDPDYDLGSTLTAAQPVTVMMKHHRCYACFAYGASCSEG